MTGHPKINDDLSELIGLFQSQSVEFMVVGAHALALYGVSRFTQDLDLFVNRTKENAERIRLALETFGIGLGDEAQRQLAEDPRAMLVLGMKPNQVDILNFLDGVEFGDAIQRALDGRLGLHSVKYIGLSDFVATKKASGRARDLADLGRLREELGSDYPDEP